MSFTNNPSAQINQLPISFELPKEQKDVNEVLSLYLKRVANTTNTKTGGLYNLVETFNSEQYFTTDDPLTFRNVYRICFDLTDLNGGPITGGTTVQFAHNITGLLYATNIYAGCTSSTPTYFSVSGYPTIYLDATNINFTNPLMATDLDTVYAVCEYLKN